MRVRAGAIPVPFSVLFPTSLLGMAIGQLVNGIVPWAITAATYVDASALSL